MVDILIEEVGTSPSKLQHQRDSFALWNLSMLFQVIFEVTE
jgi:hypothetical protein